MPIRRTGALTVTLACVAAFATLGSGCGSPHTRPAAQPRAAASSPASTATTSTTSIPPPSSTTSTTVDPGTLPQTTQLPSGMDPAFLQRISDLWSAIVSGDPSIAAPAFFPLSAYVQVKAIYDPLHDYQTRLIPDFDRDIMSLHSQIGGDATFESVFVPNAAQWIRPGVEYNKGSYWRVYGARVTYEVDDETHYFTIDSMISWRGEWYVVHLQSFH